MLTLLAFGFIGVGGFVFAVARGRALRSIGFEMAITGAFLLGLAHFLSGLTKSG